MEEENDDDFHEIQGDGHNNYILRRKKGDDELVYKIKPFGDYDDDIIDRLNSVVTTSIALIFAVFTATILYGMEEPPIDCWSPAEFTETWESYVNHFCWTKNTYNVPKTEPIPVDDDLRRREDVKYYQWGPVLLILIAFMFKVPNYIWRLLYGYSGVSLSKIAHLANDSQNELNLEKRNKTLNNIASYIHRWLITNRQYQHNTYAKLTGLCYNKRTGTYLVALYIFVKFLYCLNVIGQFYILHEILGHEFYNEYGIEYFSRSFADKKRLGLSRFPRITYCDFQIRQLQNIQNWTVQCVLPVNLFYEQIFLFLWFWFAVVAAVTCGSFLLRLWQAAVPSSRRLYVTKFLKMNHEYKQSGSEQKHVDYFVENYLRQDGVFTLRMVERNTSAVFTTDLIKILWNKYREKG